MRHRQTAFPQRREKARFLGRFVFETRSLAPDELQRRTNRKQAKADRVGARAAMQFLGPGDNTITLSGALIREIAGDGSSLATIEAMAHTGEAFPLITGTGEVLDRRSTYFIESGVSRKTDFAIDLARID